MIIDAYDGTADIQAHELPHETAFLPSDSIPPVSSAADASSLMNEYARKCKRVVERQFPPFEHQKDITVGQPLNSMPTVKEYRNEKGYYIRSNIDGRYVTLQLSPEAEGLFSDLGFRGDDQVLWQFLKPLCNSGHAYTNNSGTAVKTKDINTEATFSSGKLSLEKKRRLEEFLDQHTPDESVSKTDQSSTDGDEIPSSLDRIDASKRGFIERWSPSDDEYEATLNRIARAADVDGILDSVTQHSTEHPILVNRFRVSSQEVPTYSFDTDGIAWTVHDFRTVDKVGTNAELFIDIQPGTSHSQSITIEPETTEWHTTGEQFTGVQIDEFLTIAPDLLYYIHHLVSSPSASPRDIISNPTADITSEATPRVDAFGDLEAVDPDEYNRALGTILSLGNKGYGRIRGHTGHSFTFSEEEIEDGSINPGDVVTFEVKPHRGFVYAKDISKEEIGIPSSEIVRNWPEWRDRSLSWLRNNWTKDRAKRDTNGKAVSLGSSDEEADYQCIGVQVDSLTFYLASSANETDEVVDEAVRTLLKQTIDGEKTIPRAPVATHEVEISLPTNLLSMIDSVVGDSSVYETRDQFFGAALQHHLDKGDQVDLTVRVPRSYHDAAKQLAEEYGMSTPEFMREALEDALGTELHRKQ